MSEEKEDTLETFCLVAKYGDMSAHGMGDTAHVIIFNREYSNVVTNFLIAQVKRETDQSFRLNSLIMKTSKEDEWQKSNKLDDEYYDYFNKLRSIGFFTSKYDARTSWDLCYHEPEFIEQTYGKFEIVRDLRVKDTDKSKTEFYLSERWGEDIKIDKAQKNAKWFFIHASKKTFYGEGKANRVFAIAHKDDDGEPCLAPEVYSDYSTKDYIREFVRET